MTRCALCNFEVPGARTLCAHHDVPEIGWATSNRIICDFLHRGVPPPRVNVVAYDDDLRGCLREAA